MSAKTKQLPMGSVLLLFLLLFCCVAFATGIRQEMLDAAVRCFTVVIPSLYAMMILTQLLTATEIWRILGKPFRWIAPHIFHMPEGCFALFLLSQFAGYPVGASILRTLYENRTLSRQNAAGLCCVCYGGGPAFLLGILGEFPQRVPCFWLIFCANLLANLLLAAVLFFRHPVQMQSTAIRPIRKITPELLIASTNNAGKLLLKLCGIILCFSALCGILEESGAFHSIAMLSEQRLSFSPVWILKSLLEISYASQLSLPFCWYLPMLAALLSFGGCCVCMQIRAAGGDLISLSRFFLIRLLAAVLSGTFCRIGMCWIPWKNAEAFQMVSAPAAAGFHKGTFFPVCMLLIMTGLLQQETDRRKPLSKTKKIGA